MIRMSENNTAGDVQDNIPSEERPSDKPKGKKKKHKLLKFIIILFVVWWFNNYTIKTPEFTVKSNKITAPIKIAVLSDLHASAHGIKNERIINKIDKAEPDIIFLLGDMYSRSSEWDLIQIPIDLTKELSEKGYLVYFVPGEHDNSQKYLDAMSESGAHVMNYKGEIINVKGNSIQILGIDNVFFSPTFDLNNAFTISQDCYSILMAHIPNYNSYAAFGADLTICGDTHGGIIQLPFGRGPAYYSETGEWFPEIFGSRSDIYDKGMFDYDGGTMFITSGLGAYPLAARFNNRPEIAFIDIVPQ